MLVGCTLQVAKMMTMEINHLSGISFRMQENNPSRTAIMYHDRKSGSWERVHWDQMHEHIYGVAQALAEIGVGLQERIGIYSQNMRYCLWAEMGIFAMRCISVPFYATTSPEHVDYVVRDAEIKTLFVGEQYQYNNAYQAQEAGSGLKRIIIFDDRVVKNPEDTTSLYFDEFVRRGESMRNETTVKIRVAEALESDLAVIIYTSGTTGLPKGVTISHASILWQTRIHMELFPFVGTRDTSIAFLPLCHIFEKLWTYFCLAVGAKVAILSDPKIVQQVLPVIKPTLMCNVPRFWEKVYQGVEEKINSSPKMLQRLFRHAIKVGARYKLDYWRMGKKAPLSLKFMFKLYDLTLYNAVKKAVGLQRARFCPVSGAPLSDDIAKYLLSINFPLVLGYGLTESSATVSCYKHKRFVLGSVGEVIPGVDVKIDDQTNEILLKGPSITEGYFLNPKVNEEAFTEDGWFRTGDAGRLEGRTLFYLERIKDLYKTANGKYIAPQQIEGLLTRDPMLEQVAVIGDKYKFVSALIYPNWSRVRSEADERGIETKGLTERELAQTPDIIRLVIAHVEQAQSSLALFEKIKRITLLPEPFSLENGILTPTLKLKRRAVLDFYAEEISAMYADAYELK